MQFESSGAVAIDKLEYERCVPDRTKPDELEVEASYLFRLLNKPRTLGPYAYETFGTITDIEEISHPIEGLLVVYMGDLSVPMSGRLPMNDEGFIVTLKSEPRRPRYTPVGYLLSSLTIPDGGGIEMFTSQQLPRFLCGV